MVVKKTPHTTEQKGPKVLALAKELAGGEWLLEIIPPRRQIGVCVRFGIPCETSSVTMPSQGE